MKKPEECKNINEVRESIDEIDKKIIELLVKRFSYVKEIVKYKEKTEESIIAQKRRDEVISTRKKWAVEKGLNANIIEKIYTLLTEYFINEELKLINKNK